VAALASFTRADLEDRGFRGFLAVSELRVHAAQIPATPGVYAYLRDSNHPPSFLERSPAGRFRGRDPTIGVDILESRWIEGCPVVYLGQTSNVRGRLFERARFAAGQPVRAWGGRALWQLEDSRDLIVAWRLVSDSRTARELEQSLLAAFRLQWQRPPFANLR
jgi:hypothetical protein